MEKTEVMKELHAMVVYRLFGERPWNADVETLIAMSNMLFRLELQEYLPGSTVTYRATELGKELNLDLITAFIGLSDDFDILFTLEEFGLINESEGDRISELMETGADPGKMLLPMVRSAYLRHYNPQGCIN